MCAKCEAGWYGDQDPLTGLRTCKPCAPNFLQPLPGMTSCEPCPAPGVDCTVQDRLELYPGWYRPEASADDNRTVVVEPVRCPRREGCLGRSNASDASCAEGHVGPLCGACLDGFYMGSEGCARCETQREGGVSVALYATGGVLTFALLFCYFYLVESRGLHSAQQAKDAEEQRRSRSAADGTDGTDAAAGGSGGGGGGCGGGVCHACASALSRLRHRGPLCSGKLGMLLAQLSRRARSLGTTLKILLALFQVLASFRQLRSVRWPRLFDDFLALMSWFSFEFMSALPLDCFVSEPLSLSQHIGLMLALPVAGAVCIALVALLASPLTMPPHERGLCAVAIRPSTISVLVWWMLILYPTVAKTALLPFDCVAVGDRRLLRFHPEESCDEDSWYGLAALGVVGTAVYSIGIPLLMAALTYAAHTARQRAERDGGDASGKGSQQIGRAALLTRSYAESYYYWEAIEMVRKYLLTAVVMVVEHDRPFQIWMGAVVCIGFAILMCGKNTPYATQLHGRISSVALVQIALTYVSALLFYDDGDKRSVWWHAEEEKWGIILVLGNSLVFSWLVWRLGRAFNDSLGDAKGAIHNRATGQLMVLPPRELGIRWHLFLSHTWETGQDQARVIKERLNQLVAGVNVFLDVDDLDDISRLEDYVAASEVILIFLSGGYVTSKNCLRELRAAVDQKKRILVVRETEDKKGRVDDKAVRESLKDPNDKALLEALLSAPSVDWHRVSAYQDVSLLQIARQLAPEAEREHLYLPGGPLEELEGCELPPSSSAGGAHLYVSPHNPGAEAIARELAGAFGTAVDGSGHVGSRRRRSSLSAATTRAPLDARSDADAFESSGAMLLLLNRQTWSAAEGDAAALARKRSLAQDVSRAMRAGIKVVMAHECDLRAKGPREVVPFSHFFDDSQTPPHLLAWGVYHDIAVAMHGGEHRHVSVALLALNVSKALHEERTPRPDLQSHHHLGAPHALPQPATSTSTPTPTPATPGGASAAAPAHVGGFGVDEGRSSVDGAARGSDSDGLRRRRPTGTKAARTPSQRRLTFLARHKSLHAADSARDLRGHKEGPGRCVSERRRTSLASKAAPVVSELSSPSSLFAPSQVDRPQASQGAGDAAGPSSSSSSAAAPSPAQEALLPSNVFLAAAVRSGLLGDGDGDGDEQRGDQAAGSGGADLAAADKEASSPSCKAARPVVSATGRLHALDAAQQLPRPVVQSWLALTPRSRAKGDGVCRV